MLPKYKLIMWLQEVEQAKSTVRLAIASACTGSLDSSRGSCYPVAVIDCSEPFAVIENCKDEEGAT